jgi:hypothetical protein
MNDSPDNNIAAVTIAPAVGIAAFALVFLSLLFFVPLCRLISSNVIDKELNRLDTILCEQATTPKREKWNQEIQYVLVAQVDISYVR